MPEKQITIGLTGHGSGGHFYPLIAVGESIRSLSTTDVRLLYFGPDPYNQESLESIDAKFIKVSSGKIRNYFSVHNFLDIFRSGWGTVQALIKLLYYYPDVIFSKGGAASLPIMIAAKILGIPSIIHDSDTVPGRVTTITEKWARRVALSWPQAKQHLTNSHIAVVGTPIRKELINQSSAGGREFLSIPDPAVTLLVLGGSQGAQKVNMAILDALPRLLKDFYVIHQAGTDNYREMKIATETLLDADQQERYKLFGSLNAQAMAKAFGAADLVITRAGASGLFETALIGQVPAFVIPISNSVNDHQRINAYAYQQAGAGIVVEEENLKPDLLAHDIITLVKDTEKYQTMKQAAMKFSATDAADKIATELIQLANEH